MSRDRTRRAGPGLVRVTGGELRGRTVAVPGEARPTEGRVREALFSIWRQAVDGGRLLDLFAGS
ncbi:MAG TPA: RsmD family RNA methyltransferase, partial [Thermoanaerobaculia bacterium]|nr:RsmD family RNA methyltransferase [Thermoanaerobaculia bacterium]